MFKNGGSDSTDDFEALFHSMRARKELERMYIGDLEVIIAFLFFSIQGGASSNGGDKFLNPFSSRRNAQMAVHKETQGFKVPSRAPRRKKKGIFFGIFHF